MIPLGPLPWMVGPYRSGSTYTQHYDMTFCSYAIILEDLFQFDSRCPLTTKTSNVTYLILTLLK